MGRMSQPAIKRRFNKCHTRTLQNLRENYDDVRIEPKSSPFHFMAIDERGVKYIKVELDNFSDEAKKELETYRKKCPLSAICEVRIFHKYKRLPERITI